MVETYFNIIKFNKDKHYLNNIRLREQYGRYNIDIWVGDYIKFDEVVTNNFHSHSSFEVCLILDGTGLFKHGSEKYDLKKGTIFLADPYVSHEISSYKTKDLSLVFFGFDINKNETELSEKYEDNIIEDFIKSHKLVEYNANILFHYLPLINNQFFDKDVSSRLYNEYSALKSMIFEFICILTNKQTISNVISNSSNEKLNEIVEYINNNLNKKIRVKDIAERYYMSERNLRRLFNKHYNKSVHQFIEERKMKIASSKLLMGFKINEVARTIGMDDVSYFSRRFKKHYGMPPKKYKESH